MGTKRKIKRVKVHASERVMTVTDLRALDYIHAFASGVKNYYNVISSNSRRSPERLDFVGVDMSLNATGVSISSPIPEGTDLDQLRLYCNIANTLGTHKIVDKKSLLKWAQKRGQIETDKWSLKISEIEAMYAVFWRGNLFIDNMTGRLVGTYLFKPPTSFKSELMRLRHIRLCMDLVLRNHFELINYRFDLLDTIQENKEIILAYSSASIGRIRATMTNLGFDSSHKLRVPNRILYPHFNIEEVSVSSIFVGVRATSFAYDSSTTVMIDYLIWLEKKVNDYSRGEDSFRGLLFSLTPGVVSKFAEALASRYSISIKGGGNNRILREMEQKILVKEKNETEVKKQKRSKKWGIKLLTRASSSSLLFDRSSLNYLNKHADDNVSDAYVHMRFAHEFYETVEEVSLLLFRAGILEFEDNGTVRLGPFWEEEYEEREVISQYVKAMQDLIDTMISHRSISYKSIKVSVLGGYMRKAVWIDEDVSVTPIPVSVESALRRTTGIKEIRMKIDEIDAGEKS